MKNGMAGAFGGNAVTLFGITFDSNMIAFVGLAATVLFGAAGLIINWRKSRAEIAKQRAELALIEAKTRAILNGDLTE